MVPESPGLVGREPEARALENALLGLRSGRALGAGRAIAVTGEPGIGKSALVSALVARARTLGTPVFAAHAPYRGSLRLRRVWPQGGPEPVQPDELAALSLETPLVAVLDDAHRLAAEQIPAVERLIGLTAAGPVLFLTAYRERQVAPALAVVLAQAVSAGLLEVRTLGPLSREASGELLGDPANLDSIHREGAGNPQYLKVLSNDATEAGAAMAILGELADLDQGAVTAVKAAAVIGEPFRPELLAAVADLSAVEATRAIDALARADLLRPEQDAPRLGLRHRAVGELVYRRLEPSLRGAMHARAEAALARLAPGSQRRAHHAARSAAPGGAEQVGALIAAARDTLYSAPATAIGHLESALAMLREQDAHWPEAQALLARARLLTGGVRESRALLNAAARPDAASATDRNLAASADISRVERAYGRYPEAVAIARSELAAVPGEHPSATAALHVELADAALDLQDYATSRRHAETAAAIARSHHDRLGEANALAVACLAQLYTADLDTAQAAASRAADLVDAMPDALVLRNLETLCQLGFAEATLGRLTDAERHLVRGATLSRDSGQSYILPKILKSLADIQLRYGELAVALETLDELGRRIAGDASPATRAITVALRAKALLWHGGGPVRLAEAIELAERAAAMAKGSTTAWAVTVRSFHAEAVLLAGDPTRGRLLLLQAVGGAALPHLTDWRKPRWCDPLARAALAEGDQAAAEGWARLAEECVDRLPSPERRGYALRSRMYAHVLQGAVDDAARVADQAAEQFNACGERIEACRTLSTIAGLCLSAGRTAGVGPWLEQAAFLAEQCGSARLAEEVADARTRLARRPGHGPLGTLALLSDREREVAEHASAGLTSVEIAEKLFIGVRTVNSHLNRVYRKLGVSNRAALTRVVLGGGGASGPPRD